MTVLFLGLLFNIYLRNVADFFQTLLLILLLKHVFSSTHHLQLHFWRLGFGTVRLLASQEARCTPEEVLYLRSCSCSCHLGRLGVSTRGRQAREAAAHECEDWLRECHEVLRADRKEYVFDGCEAAQEASGG
jgi:hypothetical protein